MGGIRRQPPRGPRLSTYGQPDAGAGSRHLNCPRCGLSIAMRANRAGMRHCPRCVARNRVLVELFASTLPAGVLYAESALPEVSSNAPLRAAADAGANAAS